MELSQDERPTWDEHFMSVAELTADMSTCCRKKVGAVLVRDRRILATGFNGVASGREHCSNHWMNHFQDSDNHKYSSFQAYLGSEEFDRDHHEWCLANELHAEANALVHAKDAKGATIYTTWSPCLSCLRLIEAHGVARVVWKNAYVRDISVVEGAMFDAGIDFQRIDTIRSTEF